MLDEHVQEIVLRPSKAQDAFLNFVRAGDDLASDNVDLNKIFPVKPIHVNRWKDLAPSVRKSIISDLLRLTVLSAHVYPYKITRAAIMKVSAVHGAKDLSLQLLLRLIEEPLKNIFGYELVAEKHVNEDGGRFSLVGKVTELYPRLCADVAGDDTNHRTYVPDRRYSNLHSHCETIHGGQNTDGLDETLQGIFQVICMLLLLSPDNVMEESQLCKRLSDLATYPPSYPGSSFHTSHSRRLNIASQDSAEEAWKMLIQQEFVPQSLLHRSKVAVEGLSGTDNRGASKFVYSLGPAYRPRTGGLATMSVLDNLRTVKQMTDGRPVAAAETTSDQGSREVATGGTDVSVHATNSENANAVRLPAVPRQFFRKRTRNGDIGSGYRVTTTSYSSASGGGVVDIISIDDEDEHVSEGAGVHGDSDQGRAVTDGGANAEPVVMHCPEPTAKRLQVFLGREVGGFAMWYPKQGDASEAESTAAQR